jgi:hypothetical protein
MTDPKSTELTVTVLLSVCKRWALSTERSVYEIFKNNRQETRERE